MAEYSGRDRVACLQEIERLLSEGKKGNIIKVYVENFKYFNDTFGYENGEQMLKDIDEYLAEATGRTVYRYVGVEFVKHPGRDDAGQSGGSVGRDPVTVLAHVERRRNRMSLPGTDRHDRFSGYRAVP